jgi:hypothetical protein
MCKLRLKKIPSPKKDKIKINTLVNLIKLNQNEAAPETSVVGPTSQSKKIELKDQKTISENNPIVNSIDNLSPIRNFKFEPSQSIEHNHYNNFKKKTIGHSNIKLIPTMEASIADIQFQKFFSLNENGVRPREIMENISPTLIAVPGKTCVFGEKEFLEDYQAKSQKLKSKYVSKNTPSLNSSILRGVHINQRKIEFNNSYCVFAPIGEVTNDYLHFKLDEIGFNDTWEQLHMVTHITLTISTKENAQKLQILRFEPHVKDSIRYIIKDFVENYQESLEIFESSEMDSQLNAQRNADNFCSNLFKIISKMLFRNFALVISVMGNRLASIGQQDSFLYNKIKESIRYYMTFRSDIQNGFMKKIQIVYKRHQETPIDYFLAKRQRSFRERSICKRIVLRLDVPLANTHSIMSLNSKNKLINKYVEKISNRKPKLYETLDFSKIDSFAYQKRFLAILSVFINGVGHLVTLELIQIDVKGNPQISIKAILLDTRTQFKSEEKTFDLFPPECFVRWYTENNLKSFFGNRKTSLKFISEAENIINIRYGSLLDSTKTLENRVIDESCFHRFSYSLKDETQTLERTFNPVQEKESEIQHTFNEFVFEIPKISCLKISSLDDFDSEESMSGNAALTQYFKQERKLKLERLITIKKAAYFDSIQFRMIKFFN